MGRVHLTVAATLTALLALAACGQDKIEVHKGAATTDYGHAALVTAVDKFVAAGRTPEAFADLAGAAMELRPNMDRTVAAEAELKLLVLAVAPVESVQAKSMPEQIEALALTVWPTLLAPKIEADELVLKRDPQAALLIPKPNEDARAYVLRLCGGPLSSECKQAVPEYQGAVVSAVAMRRATERVRNAVSDCVMCTTDPAWHQAVRAWEGLDRKSSGALHDVERKADPDNWPVAGSAAEADQPLPEAEIDNTGAIVIAGQRYSAAQRVSALHDLRAEGATIAFHMRPEMSLAQVRGLLGDAKKAGATHVAVIARNPHYPWERKLYWIADGSGPKTGLRQTDSLQLLLHAVDAVSGPGTIARVD